MIYNPKNPLDVKNARLYFDKLIKGDMPFEITKKAGRRSLKQNAYLHLILSYFASLTGNTLDYVKLHLFKIVVNPQIFIAEKEDMLIGRTKYIRSSAELTTDEMTTAIERFRNWSADVASIALPDATSEEELIYMQQEVERYKNYL